MNQIPAREKTAIWEDSFRTLYWNHVKIRNSKLEFLWLFLNNQISPWKIPLIKCIITSPVGQ